MCQGRAKPLGRWCETGMPGPDHTGGITRPQMDMVWVAPAKIRLSSIHGSLIIIPYETNTTTEDSGMSCEIKLEGNTFSIRNRIKGMGGRWVKQERAWYVPAEHRQELQEILDHEHVRQLRKTLGRKKFEEQHPELAAANANTSARAWLGFIEDAVLSGRCWYEKGEDKVAECKEALERLGQDVNWIDEELKRLRDLDVSYAGIVIA